MWIEKKKKNYITYCRYDLLTGAGVLVYLLGRIPTLKLGIGCLTLSTSSIHAPLVSPIASADIDSGIKLLRKVSVADPA